MSLFNVITLIKLKKIHILCILGPLKYGADDQPSVTSGASGLSVYSPSVTHSRHCRTLATFFQPVHYVEPLLGLSVRELTVSNECTTSEVAVTAQSKRLA